LRGQLKLSLPLKSCCTLPSGLRSSTSAMPAPSEPGSHAATKASAALISRLIHSGRPLRNTATTGMPSAFSRLSSSQIDVIAGLVQQVGQIALELGIRIFAEHHHRDIGLALVASIDRRTPHCRPRRWPARQYLRRSCRHSGNRCAACRCPASSASSRPLLAHIIAAITSDQDVLLRLQGQQACVVLQQHQRLTHGLACDGAMFGRAQQGELAADGARCEGKPASNRPSRNLTRRTRRTASSSVPH
jgi:hypothetical protein